MSCVHWCRYGTLIKFKWLSNNNSGSCVFKLLLNLDLVEKNQIILVIWVNWHLIALINFFVSQTFNCSEKSHSFSKQIDKFTATNNICIVRNGDEKFSCCWKRPFLIYGNIFWKYICGWFHFYSWYKQKGSMVNYLESISAL